MFGVDKEFQMVYFSENAKKLSRTFMRYVSSFVRNSDPNIIDGIEENVFTAEIRDLNLTSKWKNYPENFEENWGYMYMSSTPGNYAEWRSNPEVLSKFDGSVLLDHSDVCNMFDEFDSYGKK